ncbi:alpha/beta fold hydrolase [Arthrobacter sp.]|uniref:esterase/lipase family protein n=1 Tax=Arthrobacter sp. TaxID=1667 RepID=UPI0033966024
MDNLLRSLRLAGGWLLDYAYVGYQQVRGVFARADPAQYREDAAHGASPVVVIPGIYESWKFMRPLIEHVHGLGHPVHVVEPLGYNVGSIARMAGIVGDYLRRHDLQNVTIIAHSKGGLIGKFVMTAESAGRVQRMVAIGTPFSGSRYATFAVTPMVRAFSPKDRVLRQLLANLDVNHRIVSVYSAFDPHIPGGCRLEGGVNIRLETTGHFKIIAEDRVREIIDQVLAGATPE